MSRTLTARLKQVVEVEPDAVAILSQEDGLVREFTYGQVYQASLQVARWLCQAGIGKGDRVAIFLENRPEWGIAYFGILLAGGVAVPLDVQYREDTVRYVLEQTRAKALLGSDTPLLLALPDLPFLEKLILVGPEMPSLEKGVSWDTVLHYSGPDCPLPQAELEDLASIIYTSGTTGPPKGVLLTHGNFTANFLSIAQLEAVSPADNFLALLPLHHSFPFMATLIVPLFSRARLTFLNTLKAEAILQCIREQGVTILVVTPQVLQHFARGLQRQLEQLPLGLGKILELFLSLSRRMRPFVGFNLAAPLLARIRGALGPRFRFFISGGAKLPVDLARQFHNLGFTVLEGYGLTETSPVVSLNPPWAPRIGSVGQPLPGVQVRILNPDETGTGEILIKGDNVMPGYYRNPAATREALRNGCFYSGDQGYLDGDGYLYVVGRLKDIIVLSSGKNVSAEEVAQHYLQCRKIKEIHVLPDPREEKLVAVVVPNFDHFRDTGESDIYGEVKWQLEYYSQQLEPYKRIRDFVLTNQELPKTRLGKIKGYEVAAIYQQRAGKRYEGRKTALEEGVSDLGEEVIQILAAKSGSRRIYLDDYLELDLGLDSLALVELIAALEEHFRITIREGEFAEIFTVADLIRYLEAKEPRAGEEPEARERSWSELLQSDPPPALLQKIGLDLGFLGRVCNLGLSLFFNFIFKVVFRLKVYGGEGLGDRGYILCPNHASFLDGFLVAYAVSSALRNRLFFMGYSTYFEVPVVRDLMKVLRVIPVNSARYLVEAMQASAYILRRQGILCIFPEGARTVSGHLREFKKGVAILARELGVPLVPVYIHGSHQAWPPNAPLPRPHPLKVVFGRQYLAQELRAVGSRIKPEARDFEAIALGLREEVARLKAELEDRDPSHQ